MIRMFIASMHDNTCIINLSPNRIKTFSFLQSIQIGPGPQQSVYQASLLEVEGGGDLKKLWDDRL
jgi:hypothetical protein